ncbi:MAG: hypothetical protein HYU38_04600 [Candidatus Tectomicrobia bacterium]|nr:hypothetical protein [Candidatus Tectomicrobia bacterium]
MDKANPPGNNQILFTKDQLTQLINFMASDIKREIETVKRGENAGNFLSALGLLVHTEILGGIIRGDLSTGNSAANFKEFFPRLGNEYAALDSGKVYKEIRCEFVHEYAKNNTIVAMLKGTNKPPGMEFSADGSIKMCVERYFGDFNKAAQDLLSHFKGEKVAIG